MAGTDNTHCSSCGEGWYDRPDRVGTVCPECWQIQQLEVAANEAAENAEKAKQALKDRQAERKQELADEKKAAKAAA